MKGERQLSDLRVSLVGVGLMVVLAVIVAVPRACAEPAAPPLPPSLPSSPAAPLEGDAEGPSKTCLAGLRDRGVAFVEAAPTKGVRTPLRLVGSTLGPLRLVMRERKPGGVMPVMDCELARALLDAAPIFQLAGVRDLLFSGIYQYRTRRGSSRLSEHAHGLAIDVHQFGMVDGKVIDVQRDFEPGVGDWPKDRVLDMVTCVGTPENPPGRTLRELACSLRMASVFREIITADDNSDHDNHFHIEAFPDALTRTRALLSRREPATDD
jgi:hypothetical protein